MLGTSGKVINSGPNDRVFVYFADHGAPGEKLGLLLSSRAALLCTGWGAAAHGKCTRLSCIDQKLQQWMLHVAAAGSPC